MIFPTGTAEVHYDDAVTGPVLGAHVHDPKPTPEQLLAQDVAKGMSYLHAHDILHRDLKPANILLSEHWVAKVADFGASRGLKQMADDEDVADLAGTLPYMAPEIIMQTDGRLSKPIDVWSFGCVLACLARHASLPYAFARGGAAKVVHQVRCMVVAHGSAR